MNLTKNGNESRYTTVKIKIVPKTTSPTLTFGAKGILTGEETPKSKAPLTSFPAQTLSRIVAVETENIKEWKREVILFLMDDVNKAINFKNKVMPKRTTCMLGER